MYENILETLKKENVREHVEKIATHSFKHTKQY